VSIEVVNYGGELNTLYKQMSKGSFHDQVIHDLIENMDLRHAGMDASGDIHVKPDSSSPCWNDGIEVLCLN